MGWRQNGLVAGLLLAGCTNFIGEEQPTPMGPQTGTTDETAGTSSTAEGTTTGVQGTGGGSGEVSTSTTNPSAGSTSTPGSTTDDGLDESSGSTSGVEGFPFEGSYSGSFNARCQATVEGTLAIDVDGAGAITGEASAYGRTAGVTGTVDALGTVAGTAGIVGLGQCNLTGTINEGDLLGNGSFDCPSVPCSGTWLLVGM